MPERESIFLLGLREDGIQSNQAAVRGALFEVKPGQSQAERFGSILAVWSTGPDSRTGFAKRSCGNKRFSSLGFEGDPAGCDVEQTDSRLVHFKRIGAAEVHRHGGRSLHGEEARRRPDRGVHFPPSQRKAVVVGPGFEQANARVGIHVNFADYPNADPGARRAVGFQPLSDCQASRRGNAFRAYSRSPFKADHFPRRSFPSQQEPACNNQDDCGGSDCQLNAVAEENASLSQTQVFGQFRRRAIGPERRKEAFETLHFGVRLPRAIPKIVVTHEASLPSNFSLRSFIPRCRFTRTDAGVSPVRSAISGPDIPSTRRRTRVSL